MKMVELLRQLKRHHGSAERLRIRLGVTERTIHAWLHKSEEDLQRLQADHIEIIKKAAREKNLVPELFEVGPPLWDERLSYEANVEFALSEPTSLPRFRTHKTDFLGHTLNSPFGASASVLTSTIDRIRYLSRAGCDVITMSTVRSHPCAAHPGLNLQFCDKSAPLLNPRHNKTPQVVVGGDSRTFRPEFGMVNRFGIPSKPPERWMAEFEAVKRDMLSGQLLILSVTGSARKDESDALLIDDFISVCRMAAKAGADVVEINASCNHCGGKEDGLYRNPKLLLSICQHLARERLEIKYILKIGYITGRELEALVCETAPYVSGFCAINTLPVIGVTQGQHEFEPAFGRANLKAGISGKPIQRLALTCIGEIAHRKAVEKLDNIAIIACGGVATPGDVKGFLDIGATMVQATTALYSDSHFGLKVQHYLDSELRHNEESADRELEEARIQWSRGVQDLQREMGGGESVAASIERVGLQVFLEWNASYNRTKALGARRPLVPTMSEFKDKIKIRMRAVTGR
jgi:dihydroorotate dehydrogenase